MQINYLRSLKALVALAVPLLSGWLLLCLAQWSLTAHLRDEAAHALALAASGDTPYRWSFRKAADIVSGRVFGTDHYVFHEDTLIIDAKSSQFEIGLPLARPVDLQRFPYLHIVTDALVPMPLRIVVRERLDAPERVSSPLTLDAGHTRPVLDLTRLTWFEQGHQTPAPRSAAMLRLRFTPSGGVTLHLREAQLTRVDGAQRFDLGHEPPPADIYALPETVDAQPATLAVIAQRSDLNVTPLVVLPQHGGVESQILLRNAILSAVPAAVVIPERAYADTFAQARDEAAHPVEAAALNPTARWLILALYLAGALCVRLRPPAHARLRALLEIALTLAVPFWLIIGGAYRGAPDLWQWSLIVSALVFAVSLWPGDWRWNGSPRAWLFALAVPLAAAALGLIEHRSGTPTHAFRAWHFERYFAWALLQQYVICAVGAERWLVVTKNAVLAVYVGALTFALLHWPNGGLMLATFIGGLCWCALYLRERALLPLAASHAASAVLLLALLPPERLLTAEVGVRFFQ